MPSFGNAMRAALTMMAMRTLLAKNRLRVYPALLAAQRQDQIAYPSADEDSYYKNYNRSEYLEAVGDHIGHEHVVQVGH